MCDVYFVPKGFFHLTYNLWFNPSSVMNVIFFFIFIDIVIMLIQIVLGFTTPIKATVQNNVHIFTT